MKRTNRILSGLIFFCLFFTILFPAFSPIISFAEGDTIYIENGEDFKSFAKNCSFDLWSKGKTFILTNDISLSGIDIAPIATFSGIFDGAGHTISGLDAEGAYSPAGLFSTHSEGGVIKNLTVIGRVAPEGDRSYVGGIVGDNYGTVENCIFKGTVIGSGDVGGIVGINRLDGSVIGCISEGEVIGENRTGGLVGTNHGLISSSESHTKVNTVSITPSISLDELNSSLTLDVTRLPSLSSVAMSDTGGIAGYSTGIIIGCVNEGRVGYPHIGYNVGGIVGRSCGHLSGNRNDAKVFGRKDVGGIVGQMEPYINYELSEDLLASLKRELDAMSLTVSEALSKADGSLPTVSSRLDSILENLDNATDSLDSLISGVTDYGDGITGEVNRVSEIISETLDLSLEVLLYVPDLSKHLSTGLESLEDALDKLDDLSSLGADALNDLSQAATDAAAAIEVIGGAIERVENGINTLKNALSINDKSAAEEAIDAVCDGLSEAIRSLDSITNALDSIMTVVKDAAWSDEALDEISRLTKSLATTASALSDIYDATIKIRDNIAIYLSDLNESGEDVAKAIERLCAELALIFDNLKADLDTITEGGYLLIGGISDIADALRNMRETIRGFIDGMESLGLSVSAINEAVVLKDEAKLSTSLDKAYNAIGDIISAAEKASATLNESAETLKEASEWGKELADAISDLTSRLTDLSGAMVKVQSGIDSLRENLSLDMNGADAGLEMILEGFGDMADAADHLRDTLLHLADAFVDLEAASELLADVSVDFTGALSSFADAAKLITVISEKLNTVVSYLAEVDPIQLPMPSENIKASANELFMYISAIEKELKYLNSNVTDLTGDLIVRVIEINKIFNSLSDDIVDIIYGLGDGSIIDKDVSENEISSVTYGKVFSCVNNGSINGDINVGGISGVMGLEVALDPEDDMTPELSVTQKKQYQLKAVIHACRNEGTVIAKYDSAGGISGKMDFGLIYASEAYCSVESLAGDYVGGIVGLSAGVISESFAKCSLKGGKYVGGILGSGVREDFSGDSSLVKNCYSMVKIDGFTQYAGAVAGANIGEYENNLFVSDSLAGIDRVSYHGKAEPISYEELLKRRSIPDGFYSFSLDFIADGELLYSAEFEYGASFDFSVFPDIPQKKGYYGVWDKTELNNLIFDTKVNVIYKAYTTTLGSEDSREEGRDIFLVIGQFKEGESISAEKNSVDISGLTLDEGLFYKDSVVESWTLTIPKDGLDKNNIHFLPENENCIIYLKLDGIWTQIETEEFGSYFTFDVSGEEIEIAVIEHALRIIPIAIIGGTLLIALAVIIIVLRKNKKKNAYGDEDNVSSADNEEQRAYERT